MARACQQGAAALWRARNAGHQAQVTKGLLNGSAWSDKLPPRAPYREVQKGAEIHESGSAKWRRDPLRKVHCLELLEILENPPDCGKQRRTRQLSKDSREPRDSRDSRDSSSEKTPCVMTLFSIPERGPYSVGRQPHAV